MRNLTLTAVSGAALLGFATPAFAHPTGSDAQHEEQHDQIDEQHSDVHDQVDAIHEDAHAQGISTYEDQQLHRQLNRAHARADGNLEAQHYYQHQNQQYGYSGYGGYGANNGGYGSYNNGYNNGYSGYGVSQGITGMVTTAVTEIGTTVGFATGTITIAVIDPAAVDEQLYGDPWRRRWGSPHPI